MVYKRSDTTSKLLEEQSDTQVYLIEQTIRGRVRRKYNLVYLEREPQFSLEKMSALSDSDFVRSSKSNKLIGILKNGELECSTNVEKLFFFDKLGLKSRELL